MNPDGIFRWMVVMIFTATFAISAYFRSRARRSGEAIPRLREGKLALFLRLLFAAPIYLSILAYMIHPGWMSWSSLPLPAWLRWLATAVGLGLLPALVWVFRALGRNVSETVFTKESQQLVREGPYRWVRHPLYAVAAAILVVLGILAANWFVVLAAVLIIPVMLLVLIPREEAQLLSKFGEEYREYMDRTGRLLPRWIGKRQPKQTK